MRHDVSEHTHQTVRWHALHKHNITLFSLQKSQTAYTNEKMVTNYDPRMREGSKPGSSAIDTASKPPTHLSGAKNLVRSLPKRLYHPLLPHISAPS